MKSKRIIILVLITHLSIGSVLGQVNFKEGRVITSNNDTLYGLIRDNGLLRSTKVCLFKENKSAKTIKFYPEDIQSYLIFGEKYFIKQEIFHKNKFENYFLEVLVEGDVNLLHFYKNDEIRYYIQNNNELIPLINERFTTPSPLGNFYLLWTSYEIDHLLYKDTLYSLCGYNTDLLYQLKRLEYNHKSLIKYTKNCITGDCAKDTCVTFEKDLYRIKDKFGFYVGTNFIRNYETDPDFQTTFPVGIFFNHPFKLINERFSFQAELNYSKFSHNQLVHDKFAMPLLLKYEFFSKDFSPFMGIGTEIGYYLSSDNYKINKSSLLLDFGVNYKLSSKISLFTNVRYQHFNVQYGNTKARLDLSERKRGPKEIRLALLQLGIMF